MMDWLDEQMASLIERCDLDAASAELVRNAILQAYHRGVADEQRNPNG